MSQNPPIFFHSAANGFYTLDGVKVSTPTASGVYISEGKKIMVK